MALTTISSTRPPLYRGAKYARSLQSRWRGVTIPFNVSLVIIVIVIALVVSAVHTIPRAAYAAPAQPPHLPRQPQPQPRLQPALRLGMMPPAFNRSSTLGSRSDSSSSSSSSSMSKSLSRFSPERFGRRRDSPGRNLEEPEICKLWRSIARKPSKLRLYRQHFNSLDVIDWFLYTALFKESWHRSRDPSTRPAYLDIAANHARRWSSSWFFDRCMGWDGMCAEPNNVYWDELRTKRHCHLVNACLSDSPRHVNFSFTAAYGGVVAKRGAADSVDRLGVDGKKHAENAKYAKQFNGIHEIECTTVESVLREQGNMRHFDFMSLDVEGYELPILRGIDWNRTTIDVIVTENRGIEVQRLLEARDYDHFPTLLKDDVWVRRGSGLELDRKALAWLKAFNFKRYRFHESARDDTDPAASLSLDSDE